MTVIRQWVLMLGGAGLLCGVAQCLMPSKAKMCIRDSHIYEPGKQQTGEMP